MLSKHWHHRVIRWKPKICQFSAGMWEKLMTQVCIYETESYFFRPTHRTKNLSVCRNIMSLESESQKDAFLSPIRIQGALSFCSRMGAYNQGCRALHRLAITILCSLFPSLGSTPITSFISSGSGGSLLRVGVQRPVSTAWSQTSPRNPQTSRFLVPAKKCMPFRLRNAMPIRRHNPRSQAGTLSMQLGVGPAHDEADLSVRVRLITLRSSLVPWYYGPDKHEEDVQEILDEFRKFAEGHTKWKLRAANATG
jgi:hypothetical protein